MTSAISERPAACRCANCFDDIMVGTEAWRGVQGDRVITLCRIGCIIGFAAKHDADVGEFERTIIE